MANASLSSVVSGLVRASVGASVPSTVTDEELDRAVAELIRKEALQKAERYSKDGIRAYLPDPEPDPNLPKPNKRFLTAIIRSTDDHNKSILRAQAEAAEEVRLERRAQERKEQWARASEAERDRRRHGDSSRRRRDGGTNDWDGGSRKRRRRSGEASREEESHGSHGSRSHRRHRSRSPSALRDDNARRHTPEARNHRTHDERDDPHSRQTQPKALPEDDDDSRRSHRHTRRSRHHRGKDHRRDSEEHERRKRSRSRSRSRSENSRPSSDRPRPKSRASEEDSAMKSDLEPPKKQSKQVSSSKVTHASAKDSPAGQFQVRKERPTSPTLSEEEDIERFRPRRTRRASHDRVQQRGKSVPSSPGLTTSKMDKYFESSYDPRLDIEPLEIPTIPSTGLINDEEFFKWEAMLEIVRQRRQDKIEKRRLEKLGLLPSKKEKIEEKKGGEMASGSWAGEATSNLMDIKYNRKGVVREWDKGKINV